MTLFAQAQLRKAAMLTCCALALFTTRVALSQDVEHVVRDGDTLWNLAEHYLGAEQQWKVLAQANAIREPRALKPGSVVRIPGELLKQSGGAAVVHLSGTVNLIRGDNPPRMLTDKDRVINGDVVRTERDGFTTLQFRDGSYVRIPGSSEVRMSNAAYSVRKKRVDVSIDLSNGRIESNVQKLNPKSDFRVTTPLAVAAVRGTHFGVSTDGSRYVTSDVLEGYVNVASVNSTNKPSQVQVRAGEGTSVTGDGVPLAPVKLLPAINIPEQPNVYKKSVVEIKFAALQGAAAYRAYIARDNNFEDVAANVLSKQPVLKFADLSDGAYFLQVTAIDINGIEGRPSVIPLRLKAHPEPPLTQLPERDVIVPGMFVTFGWTAGVNAQSYHLQVARDAGFADVVLDRADLKTTRYDAMGLKPGDYYWRIAIIGRDVAGKPDVGPYSDARHVVMRAPQTSPIQTDQGESAINFRWDGEDGQQYLLQISRDERFERIASEIKTKQHQTRIGTLSPGMYFVRVQATDADGFVRPFSAATRFAVINRVRANDGGSVTTQTGAVLQVN